MKGVVLIPCWRRPDFLWACLERLFLADGWEHYNVILSIDRDSHEDVDRIATEATLRAPHRVRIIRPGQHAYTGNSFNVLHAYQMAINICPEHGHVHLVEEDVFVARGYFRFHEAAHHAAPACFCVSACRDQNAPLPAILPTDAPAWIYERPTYQSLGVSFRPQMVRRFLSFATPEYFADPAAHLKRAFPCSRIPYGQAEQDGLIGRMLEDLFVGMDRPGAMYPLVPRAAHYGFAGYNRSGGLPLQDGTAEERGATILAMTDEQLNARADARYRDITRCELERADPADLVLRVAVA